MILLTIEPPIPPLPPWEVLVKCPKHPAALAQLKAMPGMQWAPRLQAWHGPHEAAMLVARTLQDAKIAKVVDHTPPSGTLPIGGTDPSSRLRGYQQYGVQWAVGMLRHEGACWLADEMGLGKSVQSIEAMRQVCPDRPIVAIAPASVRRHWRGQFERWGVPDWQAHGYEQTVKLIRKGELAPAPCILDEAHYLKNPKAARTKVIGGWLGEVRAAGLPVMALTGTPIPTRPVDLHHPLDMLWPERFGSWWQFTRRYCNGHKREVEGVGWVYDSSGSSRIPELAGRLKSVMLRRTKAEVAQDLPSLSRIIREIDMPREAKRDLRKAVALLDAGDMRSVQGMLSVTEDYKIAHALELAAECVESGGRPLLVCSRKATVRQLAEALQCNPVTGDVPADDRRMLLLETGGPAVATWQCVTTGIDLVQFDTMIFVGLDYVPSNLLQTEARIHRIGQTKPVSIYYLIGAGTLDEVVREVVIERLDVGAELLGDAAMGNAAQGMRGGSDDEIMASIVAKARSLVA